MLVLRTLLTITVLIGATIFVACTTDYYDDNPIEYIDVADYDGDDVYYEDGDWIDMFEDLDYYGLWYEVYPFGWVWRPTVGLDWQPYYFGEWIMTVVGWTWISYEPFGWAVYHYGYWARDFSLGWVWIPDYEWAPSHVNWVLDGEYIYWSPMGPHDYPVVEPWDDPDLDTWVGIKESQFDQPQVGRYKIKRNTFVTNPYRRTVRREPPDIDVVRRSTGRVVLRHNAQLAREMVNGYQVVSLVLPQPVMQHVEEYRMNPTGSIAPPAGGQMLQQPTHHRRKPPSREVTPTPIPRRPSRGVDGGRREPGRRERDATETRRPKRKPQDKPAVQPPPPRTKPRKKKVGDRPVKQRPPTPKKKPRPPRKKETVKKPVEKDTLKTKPKEKPRKKPAPKKSRGGNR